MDFNVADSVRRDIKVLATKTRYTVSHFVPLDQNLELNLVIYPKTFQPINFISYFVLIHNYIINVQLSLRISYNVIVNKAHHYEIVTSMT